MKLLFTGKGKSVFLPWFSSYVILLLVPIIISAFVFNMSGKVIEEEITKANLASMKQMQEVTDGYLKSIEKLSIEIGLDADILGLLNMREEPNEYHQYSMIEIIRNFKIYKASNDFIDDFYVFSTHHDFALSYTGKYDSKLLYDIYHEHPEGKYMDWLKMLQDVHVKEYIPLIRKTPTGSYKQSYAFIQSLPIEHLTDSPTGVLVILLDMDKLSNLLQNSKWESLGTLLVINEKNEVIISTDSAKQQDSGLNYHDLNELSGNANGSWKNEDVVISYTSSTVTNWKYVSILPDKVFYSKAMHIRNITLVCILGCLILGGIIAYAFTKKNYSPLKRIITSILDKEKLSSVGGMDEYSFIGKAVLEAIEQKDEAHQKLRSQSGMLKNNFLLKLLKGNLDDSIPVEEAISSYEINFNSDTFAVMLFAIEDYGIFENDEKDPQENIKLARMVVGNVIEELANKRNRASIIEDGDIIAIIVNIAPPYEQAYQQELLYIANESRQIFKNRFGIQYSVSLSGLHKNYYGIPAAYREALEAMEYRIVMGSVKVIDYNEIKESTRQSGTYSYNLEIEQRFMNCIKAGNLSDARAIMHDVIDHTFHKEVMPIQMAKCLMFSMVNTMINAISELSIMCDKKFIESLNPVECLLKCKSVEEIEKQMDTLLDRVAENIEESGKKDSNELWKEAAAYIEENCCDINLSVAQIAEHLNVNASYLTSQFKGKTGDGLLEYINRTRINKAMMLLRDTEMSLNEIAVSVGYYSSNTLIRVFKKMQGITPGRFRELKDA